ncbi:MAG: MGMT family protein [Spirochaetaceae bacterium]
MTELSEKIVNTILNIPNGKVLSYGAVAALAGHPGAARQVSWLLNSQTKRLNLPWFRVINSKGTISIKDSEGYLMQKELLENEGIVFNHKDQIDLKIYMWDGK